MSYGWCTQINTQSPSHHMCEWCNVGVQRMHNNPRLGGGGEVREVFSQELLYARHCVRGQECNRNCLQGASCLERVTDIHSNRVINTVTGVEQHSCSIQHRRGSWGVMHHQEDYLRAELQSMGRNFSSTRRWLEPVVIKKNWSTWKDRRPGSKVGRIIWMRCLLPWKPAWGSPEGVKSVHRDSNAVSTHFNSKSGSPGPWMSSSSWCTHM